MYRCIFKNKTSIFTDNMRKYHTFIHLKRKHVADIFQGHSYNQSGTDLSVLHRISIIHRISYRNSKDYQFTARF